LADRLGIDSSSVVVVSSHGPPAKVVAVAGMDEATIRAAFPPKKPCKTTAARNREQARYPLEPQSAVGWAACDALLIQDDCRHAR
jgi:hypothetical protein